MNRYIFRLATGGTHMAFHTDRVHGTHYECRQAFVKGPRQLSNCVELMPACIIPMDRFDQRTRSAGNVLASPYSIRPQDRVLDDHGSESARGRREQVSAS